jgi:tRNA U34 5-methylaminomethyl-2-thiouridine-forming methyltransferase MnmC
MTLPKGLRGLMTRVCDVYRAGIGKGLKAAGAAVACGQIGGFRYRSPPAFSHQKAIELKGFLGIPCLWHMRRQGADRATTRACTDGFCLDHAYFCTALCGGPCDGQAEDACTHDCYIRPCHSAFPCPLSDNSRRTLPATKGLRQMISPDQCATLTWRDDVIPVSTRFDDPYFSLGGGLDETRHVFLGGNGLPARFQPGFHVAELGFGTGLNLLATLIAWRDAGVAGVLRYTSFEAYPMMAGDMARALAAFPEALEVAGPVLDQWAAGKTRIRLPDLEAEVVIGDAGETLPTWGGAADAWYLDGFSPTKNPELWTEDVMQSVARHTGPGGTFATYTAAGHVRRSLAEAGFVVERHAGFGRKRHMSAGVLLR